VRDPLVDLQFWLLGRDAEHPGGNLLTRAGFAREPAPPGRPGTTRYRLSRGPFTVVVWPFGIALGRCLLPRAGEPAAWAGPPPDIHHPNELRSLLRTASGCHPDDLARAWTWLAGWERWVDATSGLAHRTAPASAAATLASTAPPALYREWEQRAAALRRRRAACERRCHPRRAVDAGRRHAGTSERHERATS